MEYTEQANWVSSDIYTFVRLRVSCQKWHLKIRLDANASCVCSCHAHAARHTWAVTWSLKVVVGDKV